MTEKPPRFAVWKILKRRFARPAAPLRLAGVVGRVHPRDAMLYDTSVGSVRDYMRASRSAVENVELALREAGRSFADVAACLDFGCGHGRVLRSLQERIAPARITACDAVDEGVAFCAAEFGVRPLYSSWEVARVELGIYDLIWSGSVFTHLDEPSCRILFAKLGRALLPGSGVLVFSVHGELSLGGLDRFYDGLYAGEAAAIRAEVDERGIGFRPYQDARFGRFPVLYGMTWHRRDYFERLAAELFGSGLKLLWWRPHGWDSHHDVLAFQRCH